MQAALIVSHGSRSPKTKLEVTDLVQGLKKRTGISIFELAFLEIETPSIPEGIDLCAKQGATEILVLLNFLNSGRHVNEDIPAIVNESKKKYPHINIILSSPIGQHPKIVDLFVELIRAPHANII